jgi:hypothetical protein
VWHWYLVIYDPMSPHGPGLLTGRPPATTCGKPSDYYWELVARENPEAHPEGEVPKDESH